MSNDEQQSIFYTQYMIYHQVFARYLIMLKKQKKLSVTLTFSTTESSSCVKWYRKGKQVDGIAGQTDHVEVLIAMAGKTERLIHRSIAHETVHVLCTLPGNPITRPYLNSKAEEGLCDYYATLACMRIYPDWKPNKSPIELGLFRGNQMIHSPAGNIDGLVSLVQSNGLTTAHLGGAEMLKGFIKAAKTHFK